MVYPFPDTVHWKYSRLGGSLYAVVTADYDSRGTSITKLSKAGIHWSFLWAAQYQNSMHWMVRVEEECILGRLCAPWGSEVAILEGCAELGAIRGLHILAGSVGACASLGGKLTVQTLLIATVT